MATACKSTKTWRTWGPGHVRACLPRCAALPPRQGIEKDETMTGMPSCAYAYVPTPSCGKAVGVHVCMYASTQVCVHVLRLVAGRAPCRQPCSRVLRLHEKACLSFCLSSFSMPCLGGRAAHRSRSAHTLTHTYADFHVPWLTCRQTHTYANSHVG